MAGLGSISKSLASKLGERRAQCCLLELNDKDEQTGDYIAFQYFPEAISDSKSSNYQTKDIPGGSLPLYQWTSGGERAISFTTLFTADIDLLQDPTIFSKLVQSGLVRRNVDPRTALIWLRRFLLPRYGSDTQLGTPLTKAPRKAILYIPNSGLGVGGGLVPNMAADRVVVIMTQCDITYQSFFPSGLPRIVEVSLTFMQTAQLGGQVNFPSDSDSLQDVVKNGSPAAGYFPYPLKVKIT